MKTYQAPCGWQCEGGDELREPAVDQALAILKAAGFRAVIVWQKPLADCWGADHVDALLAEAEHTRERFQQFAAEAGGYLCHLARVQPVEGE